MVSAFREIEALAQKAMRSAPEAYGIPVDCIAKMESSGIHADEIERIVGPRDFIAPRAEDSDLLSTELSDRAVRLARIVSLAERVFGSSEKAFFWLRSPSEQLDGTPIGYLTTETGARFVEEMLVQIH